MRRMVPQSDREVDDRYRKAHLKARRRVAGVFLCRLGECDGTAPAPGRDGSGGRSPAPAGVTSGLTDGAQLTGAVAASATSVGPWPFCVPPALPRPASAMPAPSRFEKAMAPSSTTRATPATT